MHVSRRLAPAALIVPALAAAACGGATKHAAVSTRTPTIAASVTPSASAPAPRPTCPLTGLSGSAADRSRVALAVKIDNIDAARPQAGIDHADVVVEELVEGGLTRLFAVFQCDTVSTLGPIRSARTTDADLLALLHGSVFGYSGANPSAIPPIRKYGSTTLISFDALPQYFHRVSYRPAPHNVFSSTATILAAGLARHRGWHAPPPLFRYGALAAGARPVSSVGLRWPEATAGWQWTGSAWARSQNGTADVLADGHRVTAANVVVMGVRLGRTGLHDVLGNASPLDITVGSGPVWVLRDGRVVTGTWRRATVRGPLQLRDRHGAALRLRPGRTWIELLPRPGTPRLG